VLHIASPYTIEEPSDENELIRPAVEGTLSVLRACQAAGVRRVSLTSSVASITASDPATAPEVFNETHWSDVNFDKIGAYEKSKTLAERAAWDFVRDMPEHERIELTVVNPAGIMGPTLVDSDF